MIQMIAKLSNNKRVVIKNKTKKKPTKNANFI